MLTPAERLYSGFLSQKWAHLFEPPVNKELSFYRTPVWKKPERIGAGSFFSHPKQLVTLRLPSI